MSQAKQLTLPVGNNMPFQIWPVEYFRLVPVTELSQQYGINSNLIVKWKRQLIDQSSEVFASSKGLAPDRESEIQFLTSEDRSIDHPV